MITPTMPDLILPRRQFLKAAVGIIAAPAVVRFESLMKLTKIDDFVYWPVDHEGFVFRTDLPTGAWRIYNQGMKYEKISNSILDDMEFTEVTFQDLLPRRA